MKIVSKEELSAIGAAYAGATAVVDAIVTKYYSVENKNDKAYAVLVYDVAKAAARVTLYKHGIHRPAVSELRDTILASMELAGWPEYVLPDTF